jgi:hypothetical protein
VEGITFLSALSDVSGSMVVRKVTVINRRKKKYIKELNSLERKT